MSISLPSRFPAGLFFALSIISFSVPPCPAQEAPGMLLPSATVSGSGPVGASGIRDENVVMAFGDSLTAGDAEPSYPEILAVLTGKMVANDGIFGSTAGAGVRRISGVIAERNGSRMLILYGINDVLFRRPVPEIVRSLDQMVRICSARGVSPVLATYPIPIRSHARFAPATRRLNDAIRALAYTWNLPLADLERLFMKDGEPDGSLYLEDGLHPSRQGNKVMAHAFAAFL